MKDKKGKGALRVNPGIEPPSSMNDKARDKYISRKRRQLSAEDYFNGLRSGDKALFGQAITLIESTLDSHQDIAQQIVELSLPYTGNSIRIGITGVPGVGKSSFIDKFGMYLISSGHKVAVLAVDPSSERSGGSILGDKTRMEDLSKERNAFIRPSPTAGSLGGVARKTRETIAVCEAAGFDVILIETVGVGQSETAVYGMVDFFLLLMLAGAGDELQGIKRGIMEMCDAIFINKSDGDNITKAKRAKIEYSNAIHLLPASPSGWMPVVDTCSAKTGDGIPKVWQTILDYKKYAEENGYFEKKRKEQNLLVIRQTVNDRIQQQFFNHPEIKTLLPQLEERVCKQELSPYIAARQLLDKYLSKFKV